MQKAEKRRALLRLSLIVIVITLIALAVWGLVQLERGGKDGYEAKYVFWQQN